MAKPLRLHLLVAAAVSVLLLSSCSNGTNSTSHNESASQPIDTGNFTGPYAADFAYHYSIAPNNEIKQILAKSSITEAEYNTVISAYKKCVSDYGYEIVDYTLEGSHGLNFPEGTDVDLSNKRTSECAISSGEADVAALYSRIKRNPDKLDEAEIMTKCLVKKGAVQNIFTAADYRASMQPGQFPDNLPYLDPNEGPNLFKQCNIDPLGRNG